MPERNRLAPDAPRVEQTLRLPDSRLEAFREWALEGTGLSAAARIRDPDGRVALVRNGWTDGWFVPGGAVEPGETPAEAARREVREETGLEATIGEPLVVLEQTYRSDADGTVRFSAEYVIYAATATGGIPDASRLGVADDEIAAAGWFERLPENLHDGGLVRPYLRSDG